MYHENYPRSVQLQPMDKFRMVLVKHEHKDPAVSMYFKVHLLHQTTRQTGRRGTLEMTMTPLTTIKIGTPIPFGDCQETVNLAHIINMTGYLVQLLAQPNLNFNLTQHQFKLYVSTLWFGQPHQPQLNNTGLLGPIPRRRKTQPKQQFQYNSNINTIPMKITNIFK